MPQTPYSPAKTVQKTFWLLEHLAKRQPARPSELVQQLKLTRSNVHRLLSTLQELGYIEKTADSRYRLTFKLFSLGNTVFLSNNLPDTAHPYMARLADKSQENVNLAVMFEQKLLYIDKIESPHYLKLDQPVGRTDPLHCTALGKILLSGLSDPELQTYLKSTRLLPYTKKTITDPEVLLGVIRNVRKQGYATDFEELGEGIHCIAAPIRDHTHKVIAAISISGPALRLKEQKMEELIGSLIDTCKEISKKLGSTGFES